MEKEENPLKEVLESLVRYSAAEIQAASAVAALYPRMASYMAADRIDWAITLKIKVIVYFTHSFKDFVFVNEYVNASWKKEEVDPFTVKYVEVLFKAIEADKPFSAAELFVKTFGEFLRSI